jgi:hypothetical protein
MLKLVPDNHLFAKLMLPEAKFIFEPYLDQAPYTTVWPEDLRVSIAYSVNPMINLIVQPEAIYSGFIDRAELWYDTYMNTKSLIIKLESPDLVARHKEVMAQTGAKSVYPEFIPHMTLAYSVPPTTRRNRWFTNQVINDFATKYRGQLLRFSGETLEASQGYINENPDSPQVIKPIA